MINANVGIVGFGLVRPGESVELPKRSFLSLLSRKNKNESTVVQLAHAAADQALSQANVQTEDIDLILGASSAFTGFTSGTTQIAPRLSWGVHRLLKAKKSFAYDVCTPDGLLCIETGVTHIRADKGKIALVVAAEQFAPESVELDEPNQAPLLSGAAAAVIRKGSCGLDLIASSYGVAKISENWLRLDLIYGEQAPYQPKATFKQTNVDECAITMSNVALEQLQKCLKMTGITQNEIGHYRLPRWPRFFRARLWEALPWCGDEQDDGIKDGFLFSPGSLLDLACCVKEMRQDEYVALFGYGMGGFVGCHIYQILSL